MDIKIKCVINGTTDFTLPCLTCPFYKGLDRDASSEELVEKADAIGSFEELVALHELLVIKDLLEERRKSHLN